MSDATATNGKTPKTTGLGSVYKRQTRHGKLTSTWWVSYSIKGVQHQESTKTTVYAEAVDYLRRKLGKVADGKAVDKARRSLTVRDLMVALLAKYEEKGRRSLPTAQGFAKRWIAECGDTRALDLTTEKVNAIIREWRKTLQPASINRHLAALRHAFKVCKLTTLVDPVDLDWSEVWQEEPEPRDVIVPADVFAKLHKAAAEDWLADLSECAYYTSIRARQLRLTEWSHVNTREWIVTWPKELTKSRKTHKLALAGRPLEVFRRRWKARRDGCTFVFHDNGEMLTRDMVVHAWDRSCTRAGVKSGRDGGFTFHDLRRSAVSALVNVGVGPALGMSISGHKTRAVFDDYAIALAEEQRAALRRVSALTKSPRRRKSA